MRGIREGMQEHKQQGGVAHESVCHLLAYFTQTSLKSLLPTPKHKDQRHFFLHVHKGYVHKEKGLGFIVLAHEGYIRS